MEPYLETVDYYLSVLLANSLIMESNIDEFELVIDHELDTESIEYCIISKFLCNLSSHYYHMDSVIKDVISAYDKFKEENNET